MKIIFLVFLSCALQNIYAQNNTFNAQLDSVFMASGDILVGHISIDKDNDRFIFESKDTFTFQMLPREVKRFTYNLPEHKGEKTQYKAIMNDFYFLEFGQNSLMQGYARYSYQSVENDGPKYFVVTKKYCFFKGRAVLIPKPESFKEDLLILIDDCPKVARKVRNRDIKINEIVNYVLEYNNCDGKIKKGN